MLFSKFVKPSAGNNMHLFEPKPFPVRTRSPTPPLPRSGVVEAVAAKL